MFVSGLDLGKVADYSALAVLDRRPAPAPTRKRRFRYDLVHLEAWELGTRYTDLVAAVRGRFDAPALRWTRLAVDQTGVGTAVVDQVRAAKVPARLTPVVITAGHATTRDEATGECHVPKKELVSTLLVLLEAGLVRWSPKLKLAARLEKELAAFRVTVTRARNETFGADASQHDDLVLALALAAWLGEHSGGGGAAGLGVPGPGQANLTERAPAGVFAESPTTR